MQSNFFLYHFGIELEKRKIVRKVHAKRILQTARHRSGILRLTTRPVKNQLNGRVDSVSATGLVDSGFDYQSSHTND